MRAASARGTCCPLGVALLCGRAKKQQVPHRASGPVRKDILKITWAAMAERRYYVYIVASKSRVIYVGVTGFLMARVLRHRAGEGGAFTRKYRAYRLVYYHSFQNVGDAIARETEIKKWRREKKVALIRAENPTWEDLSAGWSEAAVMRVSRTAGSSPGVPPGSE
jgi:putative endonuclease